MPIFQDDLSHESTVVVQQSDYLLRNGLPEARLRHKASEESIRTELCEGPIASSPSEHGDSPSREENTIARHGNVLTVSDRADYIERLKRGESPAWRPSRNVSMLYNHDKQDLSRKPSAPPTLPPHIHSLPPAEAAGPVEAEDTVLQTGLAIERPRSALHTGDFTQDGSEHPGPFVASTQHGHSSRPYQSAWIPTSPPRHHLPFQQESPGSTGPRLIPVPANRSRAPSLSTSLSSSFVFKAPTSPLVHSESNDDLEYLASISSLDSQRSSFRDDGRYASPSPRFAQHPPSLRREGTFPYQAHQPRKSLSSLPNSPQPENMPQTPAFVRVRRSSIADNSPLQLASMVGSYEESILHGRMSTTPSQPLDFIARIGVLGLGKCKPNLRCPSHVTLPFPAVFYRYGSTPYGRVPKSEEDPSPYVGQIDLESGLPNPEDRRRARTTQTRAHLAGDVDGCDSAMSDRDARREKRQQRRSTSPRAPPGGSYRIPEKGQLQIVIKNPNKTAVKLFLVPYDLAGMEVGTKTFIRQRSYSAGPIIDGALTSATGALDTSQDRPILRYLIHLNICCPSKGRYYLYKSIRVVFANRVPDGKEKLRNETQFPEPRYSVYKPSRDSNIAGAHLSAPGAGLTADKAYRRRSANFAPSASHRTYDAMDGIAFPGIAPSIRSHGGPRYSEPIQPLPRSMLGLRSPSEAHDMQMQSSASSKSSRPTTRDSGMATWMTLTSEVRSYDKLNKGDVGYGGNAFAGLHNVHQATTEGLLARKLKDLGVSLTEQDWPARGV
jgi:hypothetical protein